jgi:hypothetical protein
MGLLPGILHTLNHFWGKGELARVADVIQYLVEEWSQLQESIRKRGASSSQKNGGW